MITYETAYGSGSDYQHRNPLNMIPRIKKMTAGARREKVMPEPTVGAGFVRGLMDLAVAKGASRKILAEGLQIDPAKLEDQDNRIQFTKYLALMRTAKELCNEPALALHFGEAFDLAEVSIVGLIASESLVDVFAEMNRYGRLIADGVWSDDRFQLTRRAGQVWMVDTRKNPNDVPEITEALFARMICSSRRHFAEAQLVKAIHVTHAAPQYRNEYDRIFSMPVVFESDQNALLLTEDAWLLHRTNASLSRYARGILRAHAEALLGNLEGSTSTRERVESVLMSILHTGDANMDRVAGKLDLSRPTLFRRLKAEDTTFEQVLDELRHKMALQYLSAKKLPVNETAYLVGYSEPAAFSRAFKRWTGSSPRAFKS